MIQSIRTALLALSLFVISTTVNASVIQFSGTVTGFEDLGGNATNNPVSNFSIGQMLSGTLDVMDGVLSPGVVFGNADILDYSFVLGNTELTNDMTSIAGTVDSDGTGLSDFNAFTNIDSLGPDCALCLSQIRTNGFSIDNFAGGGRIVGDLTARIAAGNNDVPAPGGIGLAAFALIGLAGLFGLRRRTDRTRPVGPVRSERCPV